MLILYSMVDFIQIYNDASFDPTICQKYINTLKVFYKAIIKGIRSEFPNLQIVVVGPNPIFPGEITKDIDPFGVLLAKKFDDALGELTNEYCDYVSVLQIC